MVDFAQVSDKYQCTETLWPICVAALSQVVDNHTSANFNNDPAGVGDALIAAAVLRSDEF